MAEKRTKSDKGVRQSDQLDSKAEARPEQVPIERRQGAVRAGEDRRKVQLPPPPGSPVRSGLDRRQRDRRAAGRP